MLEADRSARPEDSAARACPICKSEETLFFAFGGDRLCGIAAGSFALRRCAGCGALFQDPLPEEAELASFYPETYWWSGEGAGAPPLARLTRRAERRYRAIVARDHVRFLVRCARRSGLDGRSPRLLDLGCGSGSLLELARRRGFAVAGLDASVRAVEIAREQGLDVRQGSIGSAAWKGEHFHFVTLFHLLEHVREPRRTLEYAAEHLLPGGSLIVQVPNVDSLQARLFGPRWYGLDVPRHLINFTPRALERLLGEAGFGIRSVRHFSLRDNPAAIASSLAPGLDPIGRSVRAPRLGAARRLLEESLYLALVAAVLPLAALESTLGRGGTVMVEAKRTERAA